MLGGGTLTTFHPLCCGQSMYRVTLVVAYLGWVDLDLGSSPGWWAATVATYCPSRMVEPPKSKSTQPRYATTRVTLYWVTHLVANLGWVDLDLG